MRWSNQTSSAILGSKPTRHFGRYLKIATETSADLLPCTHLGTIRTVEPHTDGCEECLKMGDTWVHLRLCLECGHVGCCDSSKNKHATKHFHATQHPIVTSLEAGEHWKFCYLDNIAWE